MATHDATYLILFAANLAFIVSHLYSWLLKWFYRPQAYDDHFRELFPAHRTVGVIYLMQIFELPYLLQIGDHDALLYVNAFSLLFFSIQMLLMCEGYFFPENKHRIKDYWIVLPAVVVLVPLFVQAISHTFLAAGWRVWMVGAVSIIFVAYFCLSVQMAIKIQRAVQRANEDRYADSEDFPVRFANIIRWVPTLTLTLLAINFYADNAWVKFIRDIIFIGISVWFCILTLNPWRKVAEEIHNVGRGQADPSDTSSEGAYIIATERYNDLAQRLESLLVRDHIFTEQHITIDTLISRLGTNSRYLTEVIRRSGYASFYDMINQHRVRHAIVLIQQQPNTLLADIADQCGFSSQASMSKVFKAQGKDTPSSYRQHG